MHGSNCTGGVQAWWQEPQEGLWRFTLLTVVWPRLQTWLLHLFNPCVNYRACSGNKNKQAVLSSAVLNILTARLGSHVSLCAAFFCLHSGCIGVQTGSYLTSQWSNKLFHIIFCISIITQKRLLWVLKNLKSLIFFLSYLSVWWCRSSDLYST